MKWIMIDSESDGPIPGDYSMTELGAVLVDDPSKTFYAQLKPISEKYIQDALDVSKRTREETLLFDDPAQEMERFEIWIKDVCGKDPRPAFISDNNGYDWMFVCWYFHHFLGRNPFGHSSSNLGSLYKGIVRDMFQNFKHLRDAPHNHDPVSDALGNVQALLKMKRDMRLKGI